jgi:hypothetical protein
MKLSILVATVPRRLRTFYPDLIDKLLNQATDEVEVIGLLDNKRRSVGEKRSELLRMAQAPYLTFIDDDDDIAPDYISSILPVLDQNPDVVVFDCITTVNNRERTYSQYSKQYDYVQWPDPSGEYTYQWRGLPAHTMVWKSEIAKKHVYDDKNYGEDVSWVKRAVKDIVTEVRIDKILYYYNFNDATTETRS